MATTSHALAEECVEAVCDRLEDLLHDPVKLDVVEIVQRYIERALNEVRPMKVHTLKSWPEAFESLWNGTKRYEFRKNDREFDVDDELELQEWDPETEQYTDRSIKARVTQISHGPAWEIPEGYCCMSISKPYNPKG